MQNIVQTLAKSFVGRAEAQAMKGKARDNAALEFFVGAYAALVAALGEQHPDARRLALFASLSVAVRGYGEVVRASEMEAASQ